MRDANEPFAVTDSEGQYVIDDIHPADRTYTLRETLLTTKARQRARAAPVVCTYPHDGRQAVPVRHPAARSSADGR